MTTAAERAEYLDICDLALASRPRLSLVFDPAWRAGFRARVLAAAPDEVVGYPPSYWIPMLSEILPDAYPGDLQGRVEVALDVIWDQLDNRSRTGLIKRMREGDGQAAEEELLAVFGFADEFGRDAIRLPSAGPAERKPEFVVTTDSGSFPVECKGLFDQEAIRKLNETALRTGEGWGAYIDPQVDRDRFLGAIRKKLARRQGGQPPVLILTLYTPWLHPADAQAIVRQVLCDSTSARVRSEDLPLVLACVAQRLLQGVWLNGPALAAVRPEADIGERIRAAIRRAFVPRVDGRLLSENAWTAPSPSP
jgi:hypothetical protein